ncbi:MAG: hypothetical protein IJ147_08020 [Lachnospiraceae bacterium]|nr:hypothetical protein [Lachnospiraceae bacterium]
MARQRKLSPERKAFINSLLEDNWDEVFWNSSPDIKSRLLKKRSRNVLGRTFPQNTSNRNYNLFLTDHL